MTCRLTILILTIASFGTATNVQAREDGRTVSYELQVFRLDGAFRTKTSQASAMRADASKLKKTRGAVTLFNEGQFDWNGEKLELNHSGCFWNGKKLTFEEGHRVQLPAGKMKMIYSPTLEKPLNKRVRVKIESDAPFQYMEDMGNDLFKLKEVTLPVGMDLEVFADADDDSTGRFRISPLKIELRSIGSREQVAGVSLPVGKPKLRTWKYDLAFSAGPRKGYGILVRPEGTTGAMLIRIAISELKK